MDSAPHIAAPVFHLILATTVTVLHDKEGLHAGIPSRIRCSTEPDAQFIRVVKVTVSSASMERNKNLRVLSFHFFGRSPFRKKSSPVGQKTVKL